MICEPPLIYDDTNGICYSSDLEKRVRLEEPHKAIRSEAAPQILKEERVPAKPEIVKPTKQRLTVAEKIRMFSGYRILRKIGSGGFGVVYLVEKDGSLFAMKIPYIRASETLSFVFIEAFKREIEILKKLTERGVKGIVKLIDYDLKPFP